MWGKIYQQRDDISSVAIEFLISLEHMLISRLRDIEQVKMVHNQEQTGATIRHLHYVGMKCYVFDFGIWKTGQTKLKV